MKQWEYEVYGRVKEQGSIWSGVHWVWLNLVVPICLQGELCNGQERCLGECKDLGMQVLDKGQVDLGEVMEGK